jgi:hypothetical protein
VLKGLTGVVFYQLLRSLRRRILFNILNSASEHCTHLVGNVDAVLLDGFHAGENKTFERGSFLVQSIESVPLSLLSSDAGDGSVRESDVRRHVKIEAGRTELQATQLGEMPDLHSILSGLKQ